jgi:hypothetical protein
MVKDEGEALLHYSGWVGIGKDRFGRVWVSFNVSLDDFIPFHPRISKRASSEFHAQFRMRRSPAFTPSLGLGLHVCMYVIDWHRIPIHVASWRRNTGSEFILFLFSAVAEYLE